MLVFMLVLVPGFVCLVGVGVVGVGGSASMSCHEPSGEGACRVAFGTAVLLAVGDVISVSCEMGVHLDLGSLTSRALDCSGVDMGLLSVCLVRAGGSMGMSISMSLQDLSGVGVLVVFGSPLAGRLWVIWVSVLAGGLMVLNFRRGRGVYLRNSPIPGV